MRKNDLKKNTHVLILAGGKGTRMGGNTPKVLKKILNKPVLFWILDSLSSLHLDNVTVVTGYGSDYVKEKVEKNGYDVLFAKQKNPLGTAHAVKIGLKTVSDSIQNVLVIYGDDGALYKKSTISDFLTEHTKKRSVLTLLTLPSHEPTTLGCIEKDADGRPIGVLSHDEMLEMGVSNNDILCGALCFDRKWLNKNISKIKKGKLKGEYPLPALISVAAKEGKHARLFTLPSSLEWNSFNTPDDYKKTKKKKEELKNG